jgi:hypothetical protein
MLDLRLQYEGGGRFVCQTRHDLSAAEAEYAPGTAVRAQTSEPRSLQQNAYLHAIIGDAFDNQRAGPLLPTPEHLKAHVLIGVGHCDVLTFAPGTMTQEAARQLRQRWDTAEFTLRRQSGHIFMKTAKQTRGLSMDEMRDVIDRVIHFICEKIVPGTTPEDWAAERYKQQLRKPEVRKAA